jgi:hypothetical protein
MSFTNGFSRAVYPADKNKNLSKNSLDLFFPSAWAKSVGAQRYPSLLDYATNYHEQYLLEMSSNDKKMNYFIVKKSEIISFEDRNSRLLLEVDKRIPFAFCPYICSL